MVVPNWLTVVKWIGAAAAIVAVIGVPVWYLNSRIDAAYAKGVEVGKAECESAHAAAAVESQLEANETIQKEADRANTLEDKNAKLQTKVTKLEQKLNAELSKTPIPTGCVISRDAASLLRNAASGDFSLDRATIPGQLNPEVPHSTPGAGEGGIRSS